MTFRCVECFKDALEIVRMIELAPDNRSDEITLQVLECRGCGFRGLAVYQESRRGRLDEELWEHMGYRVEAGHFERVLGQIQGCPNPQKSGCTCPAHANLGHRDVYGSWVVPEGLSPQAAFPMRLGG